MDKYSKEFCFVIFILLFSKALLLRCHSQLSPNSSGPCSSLICQKGRFLIKAHLFSCCLKSQYQPLISLLFKLTFSLFKPLATPEKARVIHTASAQFTLSQEIGNIKKAGGSTQLGSKVQCTALQPNGNFNLPLKKKKNPKVL